LVNASEWPDPRLCEPLSHVLHNGLLFWLTAGAGCAVREVLNEFGDSVSAAPSMSVGGLYFDLDLGEDHYRLVA
jgi:hypothetical protein